MQILKIPHPTLYKKSSDVTDFQALAEILPDFTRTVEEVGLVGLSANQVGIEQRFFIVNFNSLDSSLPAEWVTFVNPSYKANKNKGTSWFFEGCGSIPSMNYNVERWNQIDITAQNLQGEIFTMTLSGFLARVFQHEQNHLDGITLQQKRNRGIRVIK